jgi:hypothetical protein
MEFVNNSLLKEFDGYYARDKGVFSCNYWFSCYSASLTGNLQTSGGKTIAMLKRRKRMRVRALFQHQSGVKDSDLGGNCRRKDPHFAKKGLYKLNNR